MRLSRYFAATALCLAALTMACGNTVTAPANDPIRELVSVNVQQADLQLTVGYEGYIYVTTTIVGRDRASFADTTIIEFDHSGIASLKRAAWNANSGWNAEAQQPTVQVTELYLLKGVAPGVTVLLAKSINDRKATGSSIIRVSSQLSQGGKG